MFKEGRLKSAIPKDARSTASREEILAFCDSSIEQLGLPDDAIREVRNEGIAYGGELFRRSWNPESLTGSRVRRLILKLGVPLDFDPWGYGWRPKYLQDPAVLDALNASIFTIAPLDVWNPLLFFEGGRNPHFVGDFIEGLQNKRFDTIDSYWSKVGWNLRDRYPMLHRMMHLPDDWRRTVHCPEYLRAVDVRERAKVFCESIGRPVRRDDYCPAWPGDPLARREKLVSALKAEYMSPYFFGLVGLWESRPMAGKRASVRELLLKDAKDSLNDSLFWNDWVAGEMLNHWGLKFRMRADDVDVIFGAEAA